MPKQQIYDLLAQLQSDEAYTRNDAIKKIIKEKIDDEQIIVALKETIENDPNMAVRNFACSALDVFGIEHSAVEEELKTVTDEKEVVDEKDIFLLIGFSTGILIGLLSLLYQSRYQLGIGFIFPVLLLSGIPSSIGGVIGGQIFKNNTGAVLGGLLSSIFGICFALQPT